MTQIQQTRRYSEKTEPKYDYYFSLYYNKSPLFIAKNWQNSEFAVSFDELQDVQSLINMWQTYLDKAKAELRELAENLANYRQQKINAGQRDPGETKDSKEKRLQVEARYDVTLAELNFLKQKKTELQEKQAERKKESMNSLRMIGSRKISGGLVSEVDNMNVEKWSDTLIIDDDSAPYDGMAVPDYLDLVKKVQKDRKQKGLSPNRKIHRKNLPVWPEGVENHKKNGIKKDNKKVSKEDRKAESLGMTQKTDK